MEKDNNTFIQKARREQILTATIDAIVEGGYSKASLSEIAKRASISKTAIPYYFKSKDDLIRQIIITVFMEGGAYIQPQVERAIGAQAKIAAYIRANIAYIAAHPKEMAATFDIIMNAGQKTLSALFSPTLPDPRISALEAIFSEGQQDGQLRVFDAHVMAVAIVQAIDGVHAQIKRNPSIDLTRYADELVEIYTRASAI